MATDTESGPRLLVSINRAAALLDCGRTMVYNLANSGDLQLVKIGRRSLVSAESLTAYVARLVRSASDEQD